MSFLTDRTIGTILTVNDKIHIVDVDDLTGSPLGTSKQYTLQQLKTIVDSDTQDLENVLTYGNSTGIHDISLSDGKTLKADNGAGFVNLRNAGIDSDVKVGNTNSNIFFDNDVGTYLNDGIIGVDDLAGVSLVRNDQISFNLTASDFSRIGSFALVVNDVSDYNILNFPNYCGYSSSEGGKIKLGVKNSWIVGGAGAIAKTNNTAYANQLGFNSGEAFETILNYTTATANNTVTIQDGSGTLAFLTDVSSMYGADGTTGAGRVVTLTDTLTFLDGTKKLVIGGSNYLDIEVTGGQSPITFYKNAGIATPAAIGDTTVINWSYNDSSGVRTLSSGNIQNRVSSVGAGVVNSDITINNIFKVSSSGGVLVHPSASTQSVTAFLGIKQTAANPYNVCLALIAKGNTSSQTIISVNNLSLQNGFSVLGDLKSIFNNNQLSTGDISHKGFTDSNLFYSDAGLDRVGIGTATAQMTSKLTVTGDVETLGNTNGFIVLDRTNATRYRIYSDGGVLSIETA